MIDEWDWWTRLMNEIDEWEWMFLVFATSRMQKLSAGLPFPPPFHSTPGVHVIFNCFGLSLGTALWEPKGQTRNCMYHSSHRIFSRLFSKFYRRSVWNPSIVVPYATFDGSGLLFTEKLLLKWEKIFRKFKIFLLLSNLKIFLLRNQFYFSNSILPVMRMVAVAKVVADVFGYFLSWWRIFNKSQSQLHQLRKKIVHCSRIFHDRIVVMIPNLQYFHWFA